MNHKDFIKNYLPGLTRGVYAVRLLLKVAPTYIAALSICNILSGILTSIELLLSQNFLNSLTVFLSGYITIETLLFWLISIFLASVAMSGCTYVSSCLNSLVSDKFNLYITNRILEKTTFFSMKEYDNVDLYNKIHLALEETPNRCLTLLTTLFSTVRLTTQLIGITILIANYNVLILLVCIVTSIPMLRLSNRVGKFWYTVGAERAEGLRKCNRLKELLVEYNNIQSWKIPLSSIMGKGGSTPCCRPLIAYPQRQAGLSTAAQYALFILTVDWLGWLCYSLIIGFPSLSIKGQIPPPVPNFATR